MPNSRAARTSVERDDTADIEADLSVIETREDGRHARRDRNRYAVVDAYLELVREGNRRPSVAEVADRSGVSHRSVFRYFEDKDDLARTAIERQLAFAMPLVSLAVAPDAPLAERIDALVARRLELFEALGPVARLARTIASSQPLIEAELTASRKFFRSQVKHLFRPELDARPAAERQHLLAALDVFTSFEVNDLLRRDHDLSRSATAATWSWTLAKLLAD